MNHQEFVNSVYQAALQAGLSDAAARVTAAQAALESDYGKKAPGNNYFGIKAGKSWHGATQDLTTHEVVGGKRVKLKQKFRSYATPEEGIADRIAFMDHAFPGFSQSGSMGEALDALQNGKFGKYYTGSQADYEGFVNRVNTQMLGGAPVPPRNVSGVGTKLDTNETASIQQQLAQRGYDPGPVDGVNGPRTKAAVKAFQKASGLTVDGIVGPKTREALAGSQPSTTFGGRLPADAMNGIDRLVPGQITHAPTDFTEDPTGAPDARMASLGLPAREMQFLGGMLGRGQAQPPPQPFARPLATPQAPMPMQPPAGLRSLGMPSNDNRSLGSASSSQMLRLPSGKMIEPGTYPSSDGHHNVVITDDGRGNAVVTKQLNMFEVPGVIDPMREAGSNTVAGGFIRSLGADPAALNYATEGVKNAAVNAAENLGTSVAQQGGGLVQSLGGLGNTLGQFSTGLGSLFQSKPAAAKSAKVENPAWDVWNRKYGSVTVPAVSIPSGANDTLQDIHDKRESGVVKAQVGSPRVSAPKVPPAPPRYVTQTVAQPSGGGSFGPGSGNGGNDNSSGGGSVVGSSTGKSYTIGALYSNNNGTFQATQGADGKAKFVKVA
jgi:hypothetical protein